MPITRSLILALAPAALAAHDEDMIAFRQWMQKHGREYTPEEESTRFTIFKKNVDFIAKENSRGLPYTLSVNEFADLTNEEFNSNRFGLIPQATTKMWGGLHNLGTHIYNGTALADSVDWVAQGAVTDVKNQGTCGSCWSFSSTGALEGAWQIATGDLVTLSEQQLVDCSTENNGCKGGQMMSAFEFEEGVNVCTEDSYPYTAEQDECQASDCTTGIPSGGVTGYKMVQQDDEQSLMDAVMQQPVSIAIEADQSAFKFYSGGVLTKECGTQLDHGVLLVGYGTDGDTDYWKIKNSWGGTWGEDGYVRIERGVPGDGECGINKMPSYPVVSGTAEAAIVV